jgi:phosphohistidine phosphatase
MKYLYLIRHAKSSWDDPYQKDIERPLNKRGLRDAPRMGKKLKEKGIHPDLMLTSPAQRALATCKLISDVVGYKPDNISVDKNLYHASEDQILSVVHKLNDKNDRVLIFSHNPGITEFVNALTGDLPITDNIPTCGVVAFEIDVTSWKDVTWKKGKLISFDFPKNKD